MALFFDKEKTFDALGLDSRIFKAIARHRLIYPSIVQAQVIPLALAGHDCLIRARTGSGKTLAFAIPILQNILVLYDQFENDRLSGNSTYSASSSSSHPPLTFRSLFSVILVPTTELCDQIAETFQWLSHYCSQIISILKCAPNQSVQRQVAQINAQLPHVLITTPSRLVNLIQALKTTTPAFTLSTLKYFVCDEADLLFDYGYSSDLFAIVDYLPNAFQCLLCSATLSESLERFSALVLHSPRIITLEDTASTQSLQQYYIECVENDKFLYAYSLLKLRVISGKILFFVNSVEKCFRLKLFLEQFSISSAVINAQLPYQSRQNIIRQFNRGLFDILIATDESTEYDEENVKLFEKSLKNTMHEMEGVVNVEVKEDEQNGEEIEQKDVAQVLNPDDEEEPTVKTEDDETKPEVTRNNKKGKKSSFQVSRGIDFVDVAYVINFDFPTSIKSYIHRVGRTARGGKIGSALSLVSSDACRESLNKLLEYQMKFSSTIPPTPALQYLPFNVADIDSFRYRVEDILRSVTSAAVREARMKEIKQELLNSTKLAAHFEDNPRERDLLRHDKVLRTSKIHKHLAVVPDYLLPKSIVEENKAVQPYRNADGKTRNKVRRDRHLQKRKQNDVLKGSSRQQHDGPPSKKPRKSVQF